MALSRDSWLSTFRKMNDLIPFEVTRPSFSNLVNNLSNVAYNLKSLGGVPIVLLAKIAPVQADDWACFTKNNIPYLFSCEDILRTHWVAQLTAELNNTCSIMLTDWKNCYVYVNTFQHFGRDGFGMPLCTLQYPRVMQPDSCIIDVLKENAPINQFGSFRVVMVTALGVGTAASLLGLGLFAAGKALKKSDEKEQKEFDIEIGEHKHLSPS